MEIDGAVAPWRLSLLEFSLATTSLAQLEEVTRTLSAEAVDRLFEQHAEIEEIATIRTCHRIELLVLDSDDDPREWRAALPGAPEGWRTHDSVDALIHLHRVAAGLESLARGEREVREQIPRALTGLRSRHPRPVLAEVLERAISSARNLDTTLPVRRSIASIASARVLREVSKPFPRIVVVGTGAVGRQVAASLRPHARITLVYRTTPPPDDLLQATCARAVPFSSLAEALQDADCIVAAAKSGERIIGPEALAECEGRLVVIDLGLPRNIDPAVQSLGFVHLIDLEDLYAADPTGASLPALEEPVARAARASWTAVQPSLAQPWVDRLMRDAERLRRAELERARAYLGALTPSQREAVNRLTRRLMEKLLRAPVEHLRSLPDGTASDAERELALKLWSDPTAPVP